MGGLLTLSDVSPMTRELMGSVSPYGKSGEYTLFDKPMRWAQLAFVENDPAECDPDFWLDYFKRIHADGALLSAGGIVAFYPTDIPLHHRSDWLKDTDLFGYVAKGCRKMGMTIIARTDPHAARQDVYDAHPDWIQVLSNGEKRRHWANPELWVTCPLGPYNFEFMSNVHREIMQRYAPAGIFSNRWTGNGICYCTHCQENFKKYSGKALPTTNDKFDPVYKQYSEWRVQRLKELWFHWDDVIRKVKPAARFIPNGFPEKITTGKLADFFFADQQGRSGPIPPWTNGRGAKELRATLGMKPIAGIFNVGVVGQYRWKDSVQSNPEIAVWAAEGVANGMRPCFVKFSANIYDKRWMDSVAELYNAYYRNERYLRNTAPLARVGLVYSEETRRVYGNEAWQNRSGDHLLGLYQSLIESFIPFEMVNAELMAPENLKPFRLLILPNIAALSDKECDQIRDFVHDGGSILATFETSLYNEKGEKRPNFGLSDLFGATYDHQVTGPIKNGYLRLKPDAATHKFHPVLAGLEDAYRIINTIYRVNVQANPGAELASPVTLIPSYPDLPMEDVYPRIPDTQERELYLHEIGKGRVAYFPGDMDRTFWQVLSTDHGKLLGNAIKWALHEDNIVEIKTEGTADITAWRQKDSMTVHIVNLTNPMMMKGAFRNFVPMDFDMSIRYPEKAHIAGVHLLMRGENPDYRLEDGKIILKIPQVKDHEIVAIDFSQA